METDTLESLDYSEIEEAMAFDSPNPPEKKRRGRRPRQAGVTPLEAANGGSVQETPKRASGRREAPTPKALVDSIKILLGLTTGAIELVAEVEGLAMEPDEAAAIAKPLARLMRRSKWANKLATRLTSGQDVTELAMASILYGMRVYPLIRYKLEVEAAKAAMMQAARGGAQERGSQHGESSRPAGPLQRREAANTGASANGHVNGGIVTGARFTPDLGAFGQFAG